MSSVIVHSLPSKYQILCNTSIRNWIVGTWSNSRWRTCWIAENLIVDLCVCFWCWFSISMMQKFDWRPNHGSNYGFSKIWFVTSLGCWFSIWIPNLVQKCWSTPTLWPKIEINKNGGSPPSWIFQNLISDKRVSRMFFDLGTKFGAKMLIDVEIRYIVLKIWGFEFIAELAWNAYLSPQNFGFWGSGPLKIIDHRRDPKGHICTWNHVLWALIRSIRSIFVTCRGGVLFVCVCVCVCVSKKLKLLLFAHPKWVIRFL